MVIVKDLLNILLQIIITYNLLNIFFIAVSNAVAFFFPSFFISSVASEGSSLINEGVTKFDLFYSYGVVFWLSVPLIVLSYVYLHSTSCYFQ